MSICERNLYPIMTPPIKESAAYELKMTKLKSIAFNHLETHQEKWLLKVETGALIRLPDGVGGLMAQQPFDMLYLKTPLAFVGVCWYKKRKPKVIHFIHIKKWIAERETCDRKSLTEARAIEIADYSTTCA